MIDYSNDLSSSEKKLHLLEEEKEKAILAGMTETQALLQRAIDETRARIRSLRLVQRKP